MYSSYIKSSYRVPYKLVRQCMVDQLRCHGIVYELWTNKMRFVMSYLSINFGSIYPETMYDRLMLDGMNSMTSEGFSMKLQFVHMSHYYTLCMTLAQSQKTLPSYLLQETQHRFYPFSSQKRILEKVINLKDHWFKTKNNLLSYLVFWQCYCLHCIKFHSVCKSIQWREHLWNGSLLT